MNKQRIGLSLSGGGYRAAAFHLGTLKKLHELKLLAQIDVLSTVSGGSITGAYYCLHKDDFASFEASLKAKLCTKSVIRFVLGTRTFWRATGVLTCFIGIALYLLFTPYAYLAALVVLVLCGLLVRYQFRLLPISREIERAYNQFFFNEATLSALPDQPTLAIASTNLDTCRPFTFSKRMMGDSTYQHEHAPSVFFVSDHFPLARAVMASSCVPFAFTPVHIDRQYYRLPADYERVTPQLIDGGVYDNQGIQKLTQRGSSYDCDIIITSDAGNKLPLAGAYNNTFALLLRTVDTFMARIKNFQMASHLYNNKRSDQRQVAYLSLGWDLVNSIPGFITSLKAGNITQTVIDAHAIPEVWLSNVAEYEAQLLDLLKRNVDYERIWEGDVTAAELSTARTVSTNLMKLTINQVDCLMKHAANMTELQLRLYCPNLLNKNGSVTPSIQRQRV